MSDALLTLEDLPDGWSSEPRDEEDDLDPEFTDPCEMFNEDEFPGQTASADSDQFNGPEEEVVVVSAFAFPSAEAASDALDLYSQFTDSEECRGQLETALTSVFQETFLEKGHSEAAAASVTVSVEDLPFPAIGTSPQTYRVVWGALTRGEEISDTMDFVYWQEKRLVGGMVYMASEPDIADQEALARLLATKMERAGTALADLAAYAE